MALFVAAAFAQGGGTANARQPIGDLVVPQAPDWQACDRLDKRYAAAVERLSRRFARCAAASTAPVRYRVPACGGADTMVPAQTYAGTECRSLKRTWCDGIVVRRRNVDACRERAMLREEDRAARAAFDRSVDSERPATDEPVAGGVPLPTVSQATSPTTVPSSSASNAATDSTQPSVVLTLPLPTGQRGVAARADPDAMAPRHATTADWTGADSARVSPTGIGVVHIGGCWSASVTVSAYKEVLTYCLEDAGIVQAEISALGTFHNSETGEATLFSATCPTGGRYRRDSADRFVIESYSASCSWTGRDQVLRRARFGEDTIACTLVDADEARCIRRDRSGAGSAEAEFLVFTR